MIETRRAQHLWIAATTTLVILIGATSVLVKRQSAQNKNADDVSWERHQKASAAGGRQSNLLEERDAGHTRGFDSDALEFERKLVKNAPFSATLIIETVHSSADGTSRTRTATSLIFRDEKGRTRRDRMPIQTSSSAPSTDQQPQTSTINDPVAGFTYALEHRPRLYRRTVLHSLSDSASDDSKVIVTAASSASSQARNSQVLPMPTSWGTGQTVKNVTPVTSSSKIKNEQLGEREIEGVTAEGTRISTSIPAGAIGNEQSMEIIVERWYSSELQTPVLIKRSDPRYGTSVYRLTDIKRGEPSATLFVVPSEYKISDEVPKEKSLRN